MNFENPMNNNFNPENQMDGNEETNSEKNQEELSYLMDQNLLLLFVHLFFCHMLSFHFQTMLGLLVLANKFLYYYRL